MYGASSLTKVFKHIYSIPNLAWLLLERFPFQDWNCDAELLAKLMDKVKHALGIDIKKCCYWTDSSIVLHWIKTTTCCNKKLPVFVVHRVGEIQELSAVDSWNQRKQRKPSDLVSRGVHPKELANSQLWWRGPSWLKENIIIQHHSEIVDIEENQLHKKNASTVLSMSI